VIEDALRHGRLGDERDELKPKPVWESSSVPDVRRLRPTSDGVEET
jgi:hypothetical protein